MQFGQKKYCFVGSSYIEYMLYTSQDLKKDLLTMLF